MFKNQFSERTKEFSTNLAAFADKSKLQKTFAPKTYKDTNKGVYIGGVVLSYLCNFVSILTAFSFTFLFLFTSTAQLGTTFAVAVSISVAALFVALLELIKRGSLGTVIKTVIQYRTFRFDMAIVAFVTVAISVVLSFYGAKMLPDALTSAPTLINIDSVQTVYAEKIAATTILHTYKPTKTLTKTGAQLVQSLESERIQSVQDAKTENEKIQSVQGATVAGLEYTFCTVSLCNELLLILCLVFMLNYQFQCYLELLAHEAPNEDGVQSVTEPIQSVQGVKFEAPHGVTGQRPSKIGFNNLKMGQKVCDQCNGVYSSNHKKQRFCTDTCRYAYHRAKAT